MNRDAYGISLSFLMHASILGACLYLFPALDLQPIPLVIDFSLMPSSGPAPIASAPPRQENKPPPLPQVPPKPKQLARPKPIEKVLPKAPPKRVVKQSLSRPVEKILPRKDEKAAQEESAQEMTENIMPAAPETFIPGPVLQPRVTTETHSYSGGTSASVSKQEMEHHYVKAHFVYIKKIIEENISYPPMARRMGWQGKVVVSFIVCRDGKIENLQVVESSGYSQLDTNALETVKQSGPFPSPPVRVKLVLPVTYKIT